MHIFGQKANGLKTHTSYYKIKDSNNIINGKFKIKNLNKGAIIEFIEDEFTNKNAKIYLTTNRTKVYETHREAQNILATNFIYYKHAIIHLNITTPSYKFILSQTS